MESQAVERGPTSTNRNPDRLRELVRSLLEIRESMLQQEKQFQKEIEAVHPKYRESARNLVHYLGLRQHDMRKIQDYLASLGLSSLGRSESHVLSTLDKVIEILLKLSGDSIDHVKSGETPSCTYEQGKELLSEHTESIFGQTPSNRSVGIMVTLPSDAAEDVRLVVELMKKGMDCVRINCAHDHSEVWSRMLSNLRRAEKKLGKKCRILMDLGGPKLRTGNLQPGPRVVRLHVSRDAIGNPIRPARIWLTPQENPKVVPVEGAIQLPVPQVWLNSLEVEDEVQFSDIRGKIRSFQISAEVEQSRWGELWKTAYINSNTKLKLRKKRYLGGKRIRSITLSTLPAREEPILLSSGDSLTLTRESIPGRPAIYDERGKLISHAHISCSLPEIFSQVRVGEAIWFDDGKIEGVIQAVQESELLVKISNPERNSKLRSDKGINLPDSELRLAALTDKDIQDLDFAANHADMIGLSFTQDPSDILSLQEQLSHVDPVPGVVIKVETKRSFEILPKLILAGMRNYPLAVMIARGDLAVECGYERLAEIQEEILWLCESAHIPAIWATQVLENLSKTGTPSRAEITDAAMSVRAECVMLNKGPHIVKAVETLDDILVRMHFHHDKKTSMLRKLNVSNLS